MVPPVTAHPRLRYLLEESFQSFGRRRHQGDHSGPAVDVAINLFDVNEESYPQITIVDLNVGKILRFGRCANVTLDAFNFQGTSVDSATATQRG